MSTQCILFVDFQSDPVGMLHEAFRTRISFNLREGKDLKTYPAVLVATVGTRHLLKAGKGRALFVCGGGAFFWGGNVPIRLDKKKCTKIGAHSASGKLSRFFFESGYPSKVPPGWVFTGTRGGDGWAPGFPPSR